MEYHSFQWYSIGESHIITGTLEYFLRLQAARGCILLVHLQIKHRSAASFSIGAIGTNGSIGEGFLTIGICLCILDMCEQIEKRRCRFKNGGKNGLLYL